MDHDPARLAKYNIVGFANIVDVERAKSFYRDTLGPRCSPKNHPSLSSSMPTAS